MTLTAPKTVDQIEPATLYPVAVLAPLLGYKSTQALTMQCASGKIEATKWGHKWLIRGSVVRHRLGLTEQRIVTETKRERDARSKANRAAIYAAARKRTPTGAR